MTIKTKLYGGLGVLFAFLMILSVSAILQVMDLGRSIQAILRENHLSLEYAQNMLQAIDQNDWKTFAHNLSLQQKNLTEAGEAEQTLRLQSYFQQLHSPPPHPRQIEAMRAVLYDLMQLNRNAIHRKSAAADLRAKSAIWWLVALSILLGLIAFGFWMRLPGSIANPIQARDSAKTNFIATISHELKTPIASIQLGLQLLENPRVGALNSEQQQLLEGIGSDTQRLLRITKELLNGTQAESGNIQLAIHPCDPKAIVEYALHTNKMQAAQKSVEVVFQHPQNLPMVIADQEKTAWVLTNLIANAIRYSNPDATVEVSIAEENQGLVFSVRDFGTGIAPQYLDKIFERYFRVPGAQKEGTGLGLAISKEFIAAQDGTISVSSQLYAGSTFEVRLPKIG